MFCGGCLVVGVPSYIDEPDVAVADRGASGVCRMAAARLDRRAGTRREKLDQLPVDDLHQVRAGGRCPAAATRVVRNHLAYAGPVVIDARRKPWYPDEVSCRADIAATVTRRWREYFPIGGIDMGDAERAHLD